MQLPQVSSLSSPTDIVRLYQEFFLLPNLSAKGKARADQEEELDALEVDASDEGSVQIVPPENESSYHRWSSWRTHAVQTVDALLARGQCPFALEATAALTSAIVLDAAVSGVQDVRGTVNVMHQNTSDSCFGSFESNVRGFGGDAGIRMAYAMAVVRFVNGVVDEYQKSMFATSIAVLAEQAGLPLWLVQIRHSAAHQTCPALNVLREATIESLRWLHNTYWLPTTRFGQSVPRAGIFPAPRGPLPDLLEMEARADLLSARDGAASHGASLPNFPTDTTLPSGWSAPVAYNPSPLGATFVSASR